jgi:signal transduction histidine kinase
LGLVFLILAGFASLSVVLTFVGPDLLNPLLLTPGAARAGVLVLTIGFIALVWEKERQFRLWSEVTTQQKLLLTAFENRFRVVEALVESSDRVNAPLELDDVLEVILEAAVDLVGADSGSIDFFEGQSGDLSLTYSKSTEAILGHGPTLVFPLMDGPTTLGRLQLAPPAGVTTFDEATTDALERFLVQAISAARKAQILSQERAAHAYREARSIVKSRFLTSLSDELQGPLTSVLKLSTTLAVHWDRLTETEKRRFSQEVLTHGNEMSQMLAKLFATAREEIEGVPINPTHHDVRRSVRKALVPFLPNAAGRLDVHIPDGELMAEIDPLVIDQAVSNLVDNALRFTEGKVFVGLRETDDAVAITVFDEGPGIRAEQLRRVLNPLLWEDVDVDARTGLGLHIVETMVASQGGELDVVTDSAGTCMAITIPLAFDRSSKQPMALDRGAI